MPRADAFARSRPHWLYRLFDADERLLYIGQTRNPVARFQNWFGSASRNERNAWINTATRVDWRSYPDYWSVIAAEKLAIESERPVYNRDHQPRRVG